MSMKIHHRPFITLSLILMVSLLAISVTGRETYRDMLAQDGTPVSCQYCHISKNGGGDLNPFGEDFANNGHRYDEHLKSMDSDMDGHNNKEEITSIKNPGDPDSFPDPGADALFINLIFYGVIFIVVFGLILIWRPKEDEEEAKSPDRNHVFDEAKGRAPDQKEDRIDDHI